MCFFFATKSENYQVHTHTVLYMIWWYFSKWTDRMVWKTNWKKAQECEMEKNKKNKNEKKFINHFVDLFSFLSFSRFFFCILDMAWSKRPYRASGKKKDWRIKKSTIYGIFIGTVIVIINCVCVRNGKIEFSRYILKRISSVKERERERVSEIKKIKWMERNGMEWTKIKKKKKNASLSCLSQISRIPMRTESETKQLRNGSGKHSRTQKISKEREKENKLRTQKN